MAEFYFEREFSVLKDDLGVTASGMPQVHVERDYRQENVKYVLYVTFPQWDAPHREGRELPFDSARVVYDVRGIGMDKIVDDTPAELKKNGIEVDESFSYQNEVVEKDYKKQGFRYVFVRNENDLSGVGKIILKSARREGETVIYFAVNFGLKKVIKYSVKGGKILFDGKGVQEKIAIRINHSPDHYPCLADDNRSNMGREETIDFAKTPDASFGLSDRFLDNREGRRYQQICVTFAGDRREELEKYYLLQCTGNDTVNLRRREFVHPEPTPFCPYCHEPITVSAAMTRAYKKGGCSCRGGRFVTKDKNGKEVGIPVMQNEKGKKLAKNLMYCENDFQTKQGFKAKGGRGRILPENFLGHNHYKVLIIGSKRAGKSTFISRLFDIVGKETNLDMTAEMLRNATRKSFAIDSYPIKNLPAREDGAPMYSAKSWYKVAEMPRRHYGGYSIRLADGAYPEPTNTADLSAYPFVLQVGEKDYIYFYDIAGEDAEKDPDLMKKMLAGGVTGVFFLVDGKTNKEGNSSVWNSLNQIASNTSIPLAVVLTKFDTIEKEFDENCHCLRADAYDMMNKRYDGSQLEQNIELASEEIRSYLIHREIDPQLKFENVCYFGVSSFSDSGAVFHRDQTSNEEKEVNYIKHSCSAKRMELPVIWMLKQFGCII